MKRWLVMMFLVLSACSGNAASSRESVSNVQAGQAPMATQPANFDSDTNALPERPGQNPSEQEAAESTQKRIVIRNATLSIVVEDAAAKISEISAMANDMGGWVVSSNTSMVTNYNGEPLSRGTISVRVPSERLDEAMTRIKMGIVSLGSENITGQDVTQEYVDISSNLRNLESAEIQMQAIMDTADSIDEVMRVFNELERIRGEAEVARGRLQYFDQASAFSSISVDVQPHLIIPETQIATPPGWNPLQVASEALEVLVKATQGLVDLLIVVLILGLPPLIVFGLPMLVIWGRVQRRQRDEMLRKPPSVQSE